MEPAGDGPKPVKPGTKISLNSWASGVVSALGTVTHITYKVKVLKHQAF